VAVCVTNVDFSYFAISSLLVQVSSIFGTGIKGQAGKKGNTTQYQ
jgi:hypothetical protein